MPEILSHKFMSALDASRDRLYTLALSRESTPAKAEAALQKLVRANFVDFAADNFLDPAQAIQQQLAIDPTSPSPELPITPMPADVWARLSAAVQLEAAKSTAGAALNPDSVLLSPDPLLAPKRASILDEGEAFDLSPPSRFMLASAIAVIVGIALTIYILTRPTPPQPPALANPPASASAPSTTPASAP